jgi:hypothetical protein
VRVPGNLNRHASVNSLNSKAVDSGVSGKLAIGSCFRHLAKASSPTLKCLGERATELNGFKPPEFGHGAVGAGNRPE